MNNCRVSVVVCRTCAILMIICALPGLISAQQKPLTITSPVAYHTTAGTPLQIQLTADGGTAPYSWKLLQAPLFVRLKLDTASGLISGTPPTAGEFRIPVVVTDSSSPAKTAEAVLTITVAAALEVVWKQPAQVSEGGIQGSVVVLNHTGRTLQLTVIVVAVDETSKAFALGYQHFAFKPNSESPIIPFGAQMPFGSYVVHVDAIAEDPPEGHIYRSRLQTQLRLTLQQQ